MALGITPNEIINKGNHPLLVKYSDWERVELGNIAVVQNGYAFSSDLFNHKEGIPLIRIRDIFNEITQNYYSGEYSEDFIVNHKDILIGMDGDFKISMWPGQKGLLNQRVCRIIFDSKYYIEHFLFICIQPYLDAIHSETSAVTVKHLSSRTINEIPLPLPPLPIQRAIVSKIEALFSDLDNGIANFKKAQAQLKIYRQAVLKKAFEGGFTNENVIDGELPDNWKAKMISDVADTFGGYAFKSGDFEEKGKYQVLRMGNVRPGILRYEESPVFLNKIDEKALEKALLKINDVIVTQTGTKGKRDYGFTVLINKENLLLNQRIAAIRCKESCIPKFLLYYTWTDKFKNQFFENETGNVGQGNVGMKAVTNTLIDIPTLPEQTQIVQEIESRLSVTDNLEFVIRNSIEKAEALRQSILKKAFEGRLLNKAEIEQCKKEADYEPASELLKKIKAEKLAKEEALRQAQGKKKKVTIKKKSKK